MWHFVQLSEIDLPDIQEGRDYYPRHKSEESNHLDQLMGLLEGDWHMLLSWPLSVQGTGRIQ